MERVGQVAHRQHDLVDAVRGEPRELAFEVRLVRDREERLRRRERQRPEPRSLAPDEDDGLHGFDVVGVAVDPLVGLVVVPVLGAVVAGVDIAGIVVAVAGC